MLFFTMGDFFSVCASKFRCFVTSQLELRNVKPIVDSGLSSSFTYLDNFICFANVMN